MKNLILAITLMLGMTVNAQLRTEMDGNIFREPSISVCDDCNIFYDIDLVKSEMTVTYFVGESQNSVFYEIIKVKNGNEYRVRRIGYGTKKDTIYIVEYGSVTRWPKSDKKTCVTTITGEGLVVEIAR